jgi:hypothetical protein
MNGGEMEKFEGFLFSKLHLIGSRSEGPIYNLQHWDYSEIKIKKKTNLWEEDPELQKFLGKKVVIEGEKESDEITYSKIQIRK